MMESVKTPFPECIKLLCENIKLDPYFKDFYHWSRENKVPVIVLSSGMTPIIRSLLVHLIGHEAAAIEIVSNEVVDKPGKAQDQEDGWQLRFHDDSGFGHDKSLTIRPYAKHFADRPYEPRPTLLYAGDGVSDLSAARETDLLFAKKGHGRCLRPLWSYLMIPTEALIRFRSYKVLRARRHLIYGLRGLAVHSRYHERHSVGNVFQLPESVLTFLS